MKYVQINPMLNESVRFARLRDSARLLFFELYLKAAAVDNYGEFSLTIGDIAYMFHRDETITSEDINSLVGIGQLEQRPDFTVVLPGFRAIQEAAESAIERRKEIDREAHVRWREKQKAKKTGVTSESPITNPLPAAESPALKETKPNEKKVIDSKVAVKTFLEGKAELPSAVRVELMSYKAEIAKVVGAEGWQFSPKIEALAALYLASPYLPALKEKISAWLPTAKEWKQRKFVSADELLALDVVKPKATKTEKVVVRDGVEYVVFT
jgi:hypothetical protein